MLESPADWRRAAQGLGLVLIAVNLSWLASTLGLLLLVLRDPSVGLAVWYVLGLLSVLSPLLFVGGLFCCLRAPLVPHVRLTLCVACGMAAVSFLANLALTASAFLLPADARAGRNSAVQFLAGVLSGPSRLIIVALAASLTLGAHCLFLYALSGLARSLDHERLAARALTVFKLALGLFALAAAAYFGAHEKAQAVGAVVVWLGALAWLSVYCLLILQLRDAVLRGAALRTQGARRGR